MPGISRLTPTIGIVSAFSVSYIVLGWSRNDCTSEILTACLWGGWFVSCDNFNIIMEASSPSGVLAGEELLPIGRAMYMSDSLFLKIVVISELCKISPTYLCGERVE